MKTLKRATLTVALGIAVGFAVTACNGSSSSASSGVTLAQFQALQNQVNALETTVNNLQSTVQTQQTTIASLQNVASLKLAVSSASNPPAMNGAVTYATSSTTSACAWTVTGHPANADPISSNVLAAVTCNGYYVNVSEASSSGSGYVQNPGNSIYIGFSGSGCTGTPYVLQNFNGGGLSAGAAAAGVVFFLDTATLGQIPGPSNATNVAYYWYVAAGSAPSATTVQSIWSSSPSYSGCNAWSGGQLSAYTMLANDQSVTGVASAPRPGPVLPSSP